jgi:hypothetical protein
MIVGGLASLAVAAVALACVTLYATSSTSVSMLSKTHTLVPCAPLPHCWRSVRAETAHAAEVGGK